MRAATTEIEPEDKPAYLDAAFALLCQTTWHSQHLALHEDGYVDGKEEAGSRRW
jgi:hypothetical protein